MDPKRPASVPSGKTPFPSTIWPGILAAGDAQHPEHREALEKFLRTYWLPVCAYIRAAWHKTPDDAKDLTQGFFTLVIEKGYLARVKPEYGSFRSYLKMALKHFLINAKERGKDLFVRGRPVAIEATPEELERLGAISQDEGPDRAFDRAWFAELLERGVRQLEESLRADSKGVYFEVFRSYCLEPERSGATQPSYREVADRLGISENDVRNFLSHCRQRLRQLLRERISEYAGTEEEIEEDLREVAGG